jgi:hypothetical protein
MSVVTLLHVTKLQVFSKINEVPDPACVVPSSLEFTLHNCSLFREVGLATSLSPKWGCCGERHSGRHQDGILLRGIDKCHNAES